MKRYCFRFLGMMLLAVLVLTGCKSSRKFVWEEYGDSKAIPCIRLEGGEYAVYEDYRYILRKANKVGVPEEWGYREKRVVDPEAQMVNRDYGDEVFLSRYLSTSREAYEQFVKDMKEAGFAVYAQSELGESVYTTALTYQGNYYTVSYYAADNTIDVTASREHSLSPHLQPENDSTRSASVEGKETALAMLPCRDNSTGYVIQLENGHFIIVDGGSMWSLPDLLTYLEENAPEGEIPVVEAWFVTLASYDSTGWCNGFYSSQSELKYLPELFEPVLAKDRIRVNGIYSNTPLAKAMELTSFRREEQDGTTYYRKSTSNGDYHTRILRAAENLTTQDGTQTPIYCPLPGQTYHFSGGLTVDVLYTEERNTPEDYGIDYRTTTSCYRIQADGKTVLHLGSANETIQKNLLALYPQDFLSSPDVLLAPWKGTYFCKTYQDAFKAPITLITIKNADSLKGESAEVAAYYAQSGKNYYFSDGLVTYDFATGSVTTQ